jgi:hypothetical protein
MRQQPHRLEVARTGDRTAVKDLSLRGFGEREYQS